MKHSCQLVLSCAWSHVDAYGHVILLLLVTDLCLLLPTAADQLKEVCVRYMAAELHSIREDDVKQHLLSLAAPQEQQEELELKLEKALAEYKELKEVQDSDDPGNSTYVQVAKPSTLKLPKLSTMKPPLLFCFYSRRSLFSAANGKL
jgi:hypothetical protein